MIRAGLVSITFRKLTPVDIVALVKQAGLETIEWGGDVHVPHGDVAQARAVRQMTADAGLRVAAYGSYYRVGDGQPCPFESVLESAVALGAPLIRVWAGARGSAGADAAYRDLVVQDSRRIADLAAAAGVGVAYEYHGRTLTDTSESAGALLDAVAHANVRSYWQPRSPGTCERNLAELAAIMPWLMNVHVFHWRAKDAAPNEVERRPLSEGASDWGRYLARVAGDPQDHTAMLEFVAGDRPEQFLEDARTFKAWLGACAGG
jgi:3-dehydroshikimate dehydratase